MSKLLKQILMLPAYAWALRTRTKEGLAYRARPRLGDASQRDTCCGPLPVQFKLGAGVEALPELRDKLEHVCTINTGYTRCFACRICGQEWQEDAVQVGQGELPRVYKAT
jgi:hypothetical protein